MYDFDLAINKRRSVYVNTSHDKQRPAAAYVDLSTNVEDDWAFNSFVYGERPDNDKLLRFMVYLFQF